MWCSTTRPRAGPTGPTFCWRGLDNRAYYLLDPANQATYLDYTGCGNTLNANHSVVRRMTVDALHHWVDQMHVDGFRFDLASAMTRDTSGTPMADPPVIWQIESDPVLAGTKLIAEAWDVAGLYQLGSFVGDRWREWNGKFRDDIRRFARGDAATVALLPNRLLASPDLFGGRPAEVEHSINFVACHDGFTLNDLVCYAHKHNEANLADNRDGTDDNYSTNCGVEGPSDDPAIERMRTRRVKNLLGITLIAMGVPMIVMGDEVRRTQLGNNNPYCQDNEISWFDWSLTDQYADIRRFVRGLIDVRLELDMTQVMHGLPLREFLTRSLVEFHGVRLHQPDWSDDSHTLALTVRSVIGTRMVHAILNSYEHPLDFELPPVASTNAAVAPRRGHCPRSPRRRRRSRERTTGPGRHLPGGRPLGGSAVRRPPRRLRRATRPVGVTAGNSLRYGANACSTAQRWCPFKVVNKR